MSKVVFDIETLGFDFSSFDQEQQDYLLKYAEDEEEKEKIKNDRLALYAPTAQIIAIGLINPETDKGEIIYQSPNKKNEEFEENGVLYRTGSEKEILQIFWERIKFYSSFITFNGRNFDCPFIMLRSAILGVLPTKNLLPYRYNSNVHIDLLDQLTFYGAVRKFNLDFYCKTFGIVSPKKEVCGHDLKDMFKLEKYVEIARYCIGDVRATKELYERWEKYLRI